MFIIFLMVISVFGIEKNSKIFNYIETEECVIPVPIDLKLIDQMSEYQYRYVTCRSDRFFCRTLSIYNTTEKEFHDYATKFNKTLKIQLGSNYEYKGYSMYRAEDQSQDETIYIFYRDNTQIFIENFTKEELDYLIDYCEHTKK